MSNSAYKYEIGGKTYIQKPLVLGQLRQLIDLLKDFTISPDSSALEIIKQLGDKLPKALAIILTPENTKLQDKGIENLAAELEFEISPETTIKVIEDFFACNPVYLILERLNTLMIEVRQKTAEAIGLNKSASISQKETSQNEIKCSGDTPSTNVNLTSSIA